MKELTCAFFHYLRCGLWGTDGEVATAPAGRQAWDELFGMAYAHAVTGLFVDGVSCTSARPEEDVWGRWIAHLLRMENANGYIAARGEWWLDRLAAAGIRAVIFKGSSVAAWYPVPRHRSHGDVDIVVTGGWEKLMPVIRGLGFMPAMSRPNEVALHDEGGLLVEFHRRWERLYNPVTNARLQRMCRNADGRDRELYLACLILHLQRHFLTYGAGLKQVCDVAVMLHAADLDMGKAARILRVLHAERFSRLLFGFIASYLGGTDVYPLPPVCGGKQFALMESAVFQDGYRLKSEREAGAGRKRSAIFRVVANAGFWLKRSLQMGCIMPGEAFCFLLGKVWQRVSLPFNHDA